MNCFIGTLAHAILSESGSQILYLPAGEWEASFSSGGLPKKAKFHIEEKDAILLQSDLLKLQQGTLPPYVDVAHDRTRASGRPVKFEWSEAGVILEVDWNESGKRSILEGERTFFSPELMLEFDGEVATVIGLSNTRSVGGILANPAIQNQGEISVTMAEGLEEENKKTTKPKMTLLNFLSDPDIGQALMALSLAPPKDEGDLLAFCRSVSGKISQLKNENASLIQEASSIKAQLSESSKKAAEAWLASKVAAGLEGTKDPETKEFWLGQFSANPAMAEKLASNQCRSQKPMPTAPGSDAISGELEINPSDKRPYYDAVQRKGIKSISLLK